MKYKISLFLTFIFTPTQSIGAQPTEIYEKISPSVYRVLIFKESKNLTKNTNKKKPTLIGHGSAVAIAKNLLLTNCHVLDPKNTIIYIQNKKQWHEAVPVDGDEEKDICVLYVRAKINPVQIRKLNDIKVGEDIYAFGAPGHHDNLFTKGIVSGIVNDPKLGKLIKFTAYINKGSSGGGLFDSNGKLIGITSGAYEDKVNYAVSLDWVKHNLLYLQDSQEKNIGMVKEEPNFFDQNAHTNIHLIGTYGKNNVSLYKTNIGCFIKFLGRIKNRKVISSAYWMPSLTNAVFYFPSSSNINTVYSRVKNIQTITNIQYIQSKDFIIFGGKKIRLRYAKEKNNPTNKVHFSWFNHDPTKIFLKGKYFMTYFISRNNKFYLPIYFGLYGFEEAYDSYTKYCIK